MQFFGANTCIIVDGFFVSQIFDLHSLNWWQCLVRRIIALLTYSLTVAFVCFSKLLVSSIIALHLTAAADARRQRRHQTVATASSGPQCAICGKVCASALGLRSHMWVHNRPQT